MGVRLTFPELSIAAPMASRSTEDAKSVGLFVTCLVDLFRPSVGFAAIRLLENEGCRVSVPPTQTCCGQPAYNSGASASAASLAKSVIKTFEPFDYVVAPSGSCAGMIRKHYPALFKADDPWRKRAEALAARTHELISFLTDVLGVIMVDATFRGTVTYHDSCSGLRELGIREQPRLLLNSVTGLTLKEMADSDVCCGFGGTFCVKYPEISNAMASEKTSNIAQSRADTVLCGDMGCLLNIAGKLSREAAADGHAVKARHVAEVLADMADGPAIGEPD